MKSVFDKTLAFSGLVLGAPLFLVLALTIKLKMGGPVLYTQWRPGRKGHPFRMFKFRTMLPDESLPEAQRITALGHFLRATSLDELPELLNVLKGEMSLVGPRPLLMEYLPLYTAEQNRRHDVLPGITGYAQINGRNAIAWEDKFKLDVWYVDHQSFALDCKILFLTLYKVFRREGVNQAHDLSMTKFTGTKKEAA